MFKPLFVNVLLKIESLFYQRGAPQPLLLSPTYSVMNSPISTGNVLIRAFSSAKLALTLFAIVASFHQAVSQCTVVDIINASGPLSICEGEAVTFTADPGYNSYNWSNGAISESITVSTGGSYNVTVTDVNGCSESTPLTVTVNQHPMPMISGNTTLCNGASASLDAGEGFVSYDWSTGDSTQVILTSNPGEYSVLVVDSNGCSGTGQTNVIASAFLEPDITGFVVCFSTALDAGAGYTSYLWSTGETTQTIPFTPMQQYFVTVTNNEGCSGSDSVITMAPPPPPINITGDTFICDGGVAELNADNFGLPFVWSTGETTNKIYATTPGTYSIEVTEGYCIHEKFINVTPAGVIDASIIGDDFGCPGNITPLSLNDTFDTYMWSTGATDAAFDASGPGIYEVTVTSGDCKDIATKTLLLDAPQISIFLYPSTPGESNGSLSATAEGGVAPYAFAWSNGETTPDIDSLSAGDYSLTVTGGTGCTASLDVTVFDISFVPPSLSFTTTDATCGQSNGAVDLNITDGAAPFTILWSNGETTEDLVNIPAGSYSVTVTDNDGNNASDVAVVDDFPAPSISLQPNDASCGFSNGSISSSLSGGSAPFTYSWSNGTTSTTIVSVPAGTYSLTVTDANGCTAVADTTLLDSPSPTVSLTATDEICLNNNGSITTIINNGTAPFDVIWSNGATTLNLTSLEAGDYSISVYDAEGCSTTETITIDNIAGPVISITIENTTCGNANGSLISSITDGTSPFSYAWSNFTSSADLTSIAAGTYTLTVTDANNCTDTATATVSDVPGPSLSNTATNTTCGLSNGSIDLVVTGGTAPYTFDWDNGSTSEDITNLAGGTYNVTVTDDNGCTATANALVGSSTDVSVSLTTVNTTCGLSNGSVTSMVNTGSAPYTYSWNNGATTANLSNLAAGSYILTINDAAGCTDTQTATILSSTAPTVTANVTNATCGLNNGAIVLMVANGTAPYTFVWTNGATTQNLSNIAGGTYTVTVTDAASCTAVATGTVSTTTPPSISTTITNASCGNANGSINATITGGVAPLSFAWSNGATTEDLSNINSGSFTLTVTDNIGCSATTTATVTSTPAISVSLTPDDAACGLSNGSVTTALTGGTAPFTYLWTNGATTQNITNVAAGSYTVTVTDANGCTASASTTISNTGSPTLTLSPTSATCGLSNGSVALTVIGGSSPYAFIWSTGATTQNISNVPAGTYTVSVTDANSCIAVSSTTVSGTTPPTVTVNSPTICVGQSATLTATGTNTYTWTPSGSLSATTGAIVIASPTITTTYTVTGTDANSCTASGTSIVTVNTPPVANVTPSNDTLCLGESVLLTASGGITYTWVPNSGLSATTGATVTATPTVSSTYVVTVTNAANCTAQASVAIVVGASPTASATSTPATCNANNGTISLNVSGGTTPYSFSWSNGATTQNIIALSTGTYSVTVTSAQGCTTTASATVSSVNAPTVSATATAATCGLNNGSVTALVSGGLAPYTFVWSNGSTGASISGLAGGSYSVTVTDANSCTAGATATVTSTPGITITLNTTNTTCGLNNGAITSNTTGGAPPYSYTWSNGATTANISGLAPGAYTLTVTGSLGCTATQTATITSSTSPVATAVATDATCGSANGSIDITISGGTAPYTYSWSNGATTQDISNLTAGSYTITVTDATSCTASLTVAVSSIGGPTITPNVSDAGCDNTNGAIGIGVVGGTPPYTFSWSNGATTQNISNLASGVYSLSVSDDNNCTSVITINVGAAQPPVVSGFAINASCGEDNGFIDVTVSGGTSPYTFAWNNGVTDEDLFDLAQGNYIVTVSDAGGCTATSVFDVQATALPDIQFVVTDAGCGQSTGFVDASVIGGLAPYLFVWSNGQFTEDLNGVSGGTYTLTVTDDEGCTVAEDVTVGDAPGPQVNGLVTNATCANADGAIDIDIVGVAPPFTINWSNGSPDEDLINAIPGTYTVTVLDANFCFTEQTFNINPGDVPYATYTTTEVLCGLANGAIDVTPGGGLTPYTYNWSNGATTQDVTSLPVGLYSFTVTDALGCTFIQSALVTSSDPSPQLTAETDSSSCGNPNGAIDITVDGGEPPFSYIWSNGATVEDLTGLQAGNYILTITDNNGCQDALLVTVGNVSAPSAGAVVTAASCGNPNGAVNLSVSNGSPPYQFIWSNGATTEDLTNINGGPFGVTVSDDGGCSTTLNVNVNQTPAVVIGDVTGPSPVNANSTNTYSVSQQPGVIYEWSVSGGSILNGQGTNIVQIQWSNVGTYDVVATITDATTDCSDTDTLEVSVITGIDDLETVGNVTVYPNPASDLFTVSFDAIVNSSLNVNVFAIDGRLVSEQLYNAKPGVNTLSFNAAEFAAGVYILALRDGNRSRHLKLVIER